MKRSLREPSSTIVCAACGGMFKRLKENKSEGDMQLIDSFNLTDLQCFYCMGRYRR